MTVDRQYASARHWACSSFYCGFIIDSICQFLKIKKAAFLIDVINCFKTVTGKKCRAVSTIKPRCWYSGQSWICWVNKPGDPLTVLIIWASDSNPRNMPHSLLAFISPWCLWMTMWYSFFGVRSLEASKTHLLPQKNKVTIFSTERKLAK